MTVVFGREEFAAARRVETEADAAARRADRDSALAALLQARADFADEISETYASGARLAGADSDRLECIAGRLLAFVDDLEPSLERLDPARDLFGPGCRRQRSAWDRPALALSLGEALQPLLSASACAVLTAAIRLEACG